jgi:hypothetical protein
MESRLSRRPAPAGSFGEAAHGLGVVMPWHHAEREAEALSSTTERSAFGPRVDLSRVRVHTGELAEMSAKSLGARAFTLGFDIVFAAGHYSPMTDAGRALLAHELSHTLQQSAGQRAVMRAPDDRALAEPKVAEDKTPTAVGFRSFTKGDRALSSRVVSLSHAYRHLVGIVQPLLLQAGIFSRRRLDYEMYWHGVLGVYAVEDEIEASDAYDPVHLSIWVQALEGGLDDVRKLLAVLKGTGDRAAATAEFWEGQAADLELKAKAMAAEKYIIGGFEARKKEADQADLTRRMDEAQSYMEDKIAFVKSSSNVDQMTRWYGQIFAQNLVYRWHLNGDQIRALFERFRSEGHLNDVLMGGSTVQSLLAIGIGGFWEYRAPGEGLVAGAARTVLENKISHPVQDRHFSGLAENLEAAGGFVVGVFQGIGDDLIDNLKAIIDLFTPSFWKQIWSFLTEELPHLAADEEYRFQVGSILGRGELEEQRRVAGAEPFEYGRTIGHAAGVVLTEIVMLFIGIGWVLKASKASPTIMKIVRPVMEVVNAIAKTAAGKKIAEFAVWAAEGLAAIERRVQAVLLKIPRFTEAGRAERAIKEVELATERLKSLQLAAQRAASAGDEEKVVKYIEEFDNANKELDSKIADLEQKSRGEGPQTGTADTAPDKKADAAPTAKTKEVVRPAGEPGHSVKITPNGQLMRCSDVCSTLWVHYGEMLAQRQDLKKKLVELEQEIAKAYLQGNQAALDRLANEAEQFERDLFLGEGMHEHLPGTDPVVGSHPDRGGPANAKPAEPRPPQTPAQLEARAKVEAGDAAARIEKGLNDLKIKELQDYVRASKKEIARGVQLRDLAADSPDMLEDLWLDHLERLKDKDFKTKDFGEYVRKRMPEYRGRVGEFGTAFERGPDEIMVFAPKARTTEPGLDLITYTTDKRIEILDNKAFREGASVGKVSAFEKNLAQNLESVIEDLEKYAASPGSPPELAQEVLPRMRAAQKEVEHEVLAVLAKNPKADLYAKDVQKEITRILDKYGIDRRVTLTGSGPNVKVTDRLLDRISTP